MNARNQTHFAKPNFAKQAEHQDDISESWQEETGGEDLVTAFYRTFDAPAVDEAHQCCTVTGYELTGICVEESGITTWHDRQDAIALMGAETVAHIERVNMEAGL